jgi:hypothetical protein
MGTTAIEAGRVQRRNEAVNDDPRFGILDRGLFIVLTVAHVAVITVVLERWLTTMDWGTTRIALPLLIATIIAEIVLWEWRWMTLPLMRVPRPKPAAPGWRVGMAVTFVPYDLIVAVDSDHILRSEYLDRVVGYFDDSAVAFVQPAQVYYNQEASLVARGAAEETYAYYSSLLVAAHGVGYPLVVGCHNTHRVSALREIGGLAPHEADDLVMTLLYRARGWRGVYVPEILAKGLVPTDWSGYLKQQRRWARSVLDVTRCSSARRCSCASCTVSASSSIAPSGAFTGARSCSALSSGRGSSWPRSTRSAAVTAST